MIEHAPQSRARVAATLVAAASIALLLVLRLTDYAHHAFYFKVLASTAFVTVAVLGDVLATTYGRLVALALVGCWFGDVLGTRPGSLGPYAFIAAHIVFIAAFLRKGISGQRVRWLVLPVTATGTAAAVYFVPGQPPAETVLILAYLSVLTTMLLTAAGVTGPVGALTLPAGILFYISDLFVALSRYDRISDTASMFGCYPLYYSACLLFAWSAAVNTATPDPQPTKPVPTQVRQN